ncbi:MAG: hypothetical protein OEY93_00515 [Anaerolineae bacterium]|nr:hypothetical protein [Anaerolineae bacterium]
MKTRRLFAILIILLGVGAASASQAQAQPAMVVAPWESCATSAANGLIKKSHCRTAVALYNSTNGASWITKTNWKTTGDVCAWYGITCNGATPPRITVINLNNNNLAGPLPDNLGNIKTLNSLILYDNLITGPLPASFGNLTNLTNVDLSYNMISGSIPSSIGNMTGMLNLSLSNNQFTGIVPASLGNLTSNAILSLNDNNLSGNMPKELSGASSLHYLFLYNNPNLTWAIPMSYAGLPLTKFDYSGTDLCAPTSITYNFWEISIPAITNSQTCSPIFMDGFESGNRSAWTSSVGATALEDDYSASAVCKLCVKKLGSLVDQYSMIVKVSDRLPHYVVNDYTNLESGYNVRFQIKVGNTLNMAHLNKIRVLQGRQGATQVFFLEIRKNGTKFQVQAAARRNDGTYARTNWYLLPKKSSTLEVNWSPGAGGTGSITLYVNGNLKQTKTGFSNDTLDVVYVRWGTTKPLKPAYVITGSYKLDAYASDGSQYIGKP